MTCVLLRLAQHSVDTRVGRPRWRQRWGPRRAVGRLSVRRRQQRWLRRRERRAGAGERRERTAGGAEVGRYTHRSGTGAGGRAGHALPRDDVPRAEPRPGRVSSSVPSSVSSCSMSSNAAMFPGRSLGPVVCHHMAGSVVPNGASNAFVRSFLRSFVRSSACIFCRRTAPHATLASQPRVIRTIPGVPTVRPPRVVAWRRLVAPGILAPNLLRLYSTFRGSETADLNHSISPN